MLRSVYRRFYAEIAKRIDRALSGNIVELGAGLGTIKDVIPDCVTTDVAPHAWLDRTENAYALSFPSGTVSNLILFDVWHHLQYPGTALDEFARVLQPGGRVIVFEPAMGVLGWLVYGLFHPEPLGLCRPIPWRAPEGFNAAAPSYYAAQANFWRMIRTDGRDSRLGQWHVREISYYPAFAYLASGGFRGPQLFPYRGIGVLEGMEKLAKPLPWLFATRMLAVLEKKS